MLQLLVALRQFFILPGKQVALRGQLLLQIRLLRLGMETAWEDLKVKEEALRFACLLWFHYIRASCG